MNLNATILGQSVLFVLFVWLCMKYIWPFIMNAIEVRQREIADSLAAASRAKKELDLAQSNAVHFLKNAKLEAKVIIEQANKWGAHIVDEARNKAKQERSNMIEQAQVDLKAECNRVRQELRNQVAILAIAAAEKIIERSVDTTTNNDIIDKLVAKL